MTKIDPSSSSVQTLPPNYNMMSIEDKRFCVRRMLQQDVRRLSNIFVGGSIVTLLFERFFTFDPAKALKEESLNIMWTNLLKT